VTESLITWEPVAGVASPCASVVLHADTAHFTVRLCFSEMTESSGRDLLVVFGGRVLACMSHEEFTHPWNTGRAEEMWPRLGGAWATYAFPLLKVQRSLWLASFSDSQVLDPERATAHHYRFISLDNIVDVLTTTEPTAEWVAPAR
jgi:hypothetical protein